MAKKAKTAKAPPPRSAARERADFIEALTRHGQLQKSGGKLQPGATHVVETDARGRPRIVRKRFSAT